jgi:hypothetical protein
MSEQLLTILKLCLLALLYLFFFRVLRAVWAEIRAPVPVGTGGRGGAAAPPTAAPTPRPTPPPEPPRRSRSPHPSQLVVVEPADEAGAAYQIGDELTVGRAAGCAVSLPADTYVSSLHARVFRTAEGEVNLEDLGSTNGTLVNTAKVHNAVVLRRGDRIQVGNTVLEAR